MPSWGLPLNLSQSLRLSLSVSSSFTYLRYQGSSSNTHCNNIAFLFMSFVYNCKVEVATELLRYYKRRKFLAFGFICVFLFSQLHICVSNYVTDTGVTCVKCVQIEPGLDCDTNLANSHGDCHDCCSLQACEDDNQHTAKIVSYSSVELVAVLPAQFDIASYQAVSEQSVLVPFDPSAPTTGPPLNKSSRAPPVF